MVAHAYQRFKSVVKEVMQADGNIILFIDEIHTLVGDGSHNAPSIHEG